MASKTFTINYPRLVLDNSVYGFHTEYITLKKRVTDRMEARDSWKKVYACNYFQNIIRDTYGLKNATVHTRDIKEA